jgi:hypothetical protein
MDAKQTVKYVAVHQLLATTATVVGLGIVGVGAWLGFGDAARIVLNDAPQNWGDAVAAADPTTFAVFAVVGVLVWQVGKTLALVATVRKAAPGTASDDGPDAAAVKRAVMNDVNDRISAVESDVKRHEDAISQASSASSEGSAGAGDGGSRRSRRRGSATTERASEDEESAATERASESEKSAASNGGDAATGRGSRESNRKSNRRASRASESRESSSGDDDAN